MLYPAGYLLVTCWLPRPTVQNKPLSPLCVRNELTESQCWFVQLLKVPAEEREQILGSNSTPTLTSLPDECSEAWE